MKFIDLEKSYYNFNIKINIVEFVFYMSHNLADILPDFLGLNFIKDPNKFF